MNVSIQLKEPHAIVTGGASGLGLAIVRRLIASGARVSIWDSDKAALQKLPQELGKAVHIEQIDVSQEEQVARAVQTSTQAFGDISILVNNAGIAGPHMPTWELDLDSWQRVLTVNLTSAFLCSRALIPQMMTLPSARIINIASIAGKDGNAMIAAYAASKAGVISLTKTLGKELAHTNVRVNCITPGAIRTAIFDQWPDDYVQSLLDKIPLGRFGKPEELAAMVTWLCSEDASFSTGAIFDMSGGRAVY